MKQHNREYDVNATFVRVSRRVPSVLYEPKGREGEKLNAILVMHSDEDYMSMPTGPELAKRGYCVLCANVMSKEGCFFTQPEKMSSVKESIEYLRSLDCVDKVILMGHSGGATLMTAYQAIAESGVEVFQGPQMIYPHPDVGILPPADGVMLLDSNWGNAAMQLFSLDPAVEDEAIGTVLNREYNLFEPENGFDPNGSSFSEEFTKKFQKRQGERNNAILRYAQSRLENIRKGVGDYSDDEPLAIPGANQAFYNNKLFAQDIRLMSRTKNPYLLLHGDGSRTVEIVKSVRQPENPESMTHSLIKGGRIMTVVNYLTSYAVRTTEEFGYDASSVYGVDWDSTYNCPPGNVQHFHVPLLVMGMTGGWEYLAAETIYEMAASEDKTIAFVEGASHKFRPVRDSEQYPGQFGDTMKTLHDFVDEWLSEKF